MALVSSPDGLATGMLQPLRETTRELPRTALRLPSEIDELIVDTNDDVLRFVSGGRWLRCGQPVLVSRSLRCR
ncbi:hypothetical protein EB74_27580 [Mycobacterium sp. SWH-M5]|nr:hypothetical protein EB74_27580 [Mycobacterium sp. SWH-M5]